MKKNCKMDVWFEKYQAESLDRFWKHQNEILWELEENLDVCNDEFISAITRLQETSLAVFKEYNRVQNSIYLTDKQSKYLDKSRDNLSEMMIHRYEIELEKVSLNSKLIYKFPKKGKVLIIGCENDSIVEWISGKNLSAVIVPDNLYDEELIPFFEEEVAGVVGIAGEDWNEESGLNFVKQLFFAAKYLSISWSKNRNHPFFAAVTYLGGRFGFESGAKNFVTGSISGLCKTVKREWNNNVNVKYIDVVRETSDCDVVQYIENELCFGEDIEIGYLADKTRIKMALREKYDTEMSDNIPSDRDVFLVSGGGRGITATCIIELAKKYKSTFILIARTKLCDEPEDFKDGKDLLSLRELMIKKKISNKEKVVLPEIDAAAKEILAQREIKATIAKLKSLGSKVMLLSCDVTRFEDLKAAVKTATDKFGKITGIIHGAGLIRDKFLREKTRKDFDDIFGVKYYGLNNMIDLVNMAEIKYIILYSSIAGHFGNRGQADYSCANEYLNHFARYWKTINPMCNIMSVNWGPWDAGMLDSALKREMIKRGKVLIEPDIGAKFFMDVLEQKHAPGVCQIIINDVDKLGGAS